MEPAEGLKSKIRQILDSLKSDKQKLAMIHSLVFINPSSLEELHKTMKHPNWFDMKPVSKKLENKVFNINPYIK